MGISLNKIEKLKVLGVFTESLLTLHLEDPKEFHPVYIADKLFSKCEELGIELEVEEDARG